MAMMVLRSSGAAPQRNALPAWLMAATLALLACAPGSALAQRPCPETATPPDYVTTVKAARAALMRPAATRVPNDVCDRGQYGGSGPTNLPYFDDHSWRTFIALVWPALESKYESNNGIVTIRERGVPNPEEDLEKVPLKPEAVPDGPSLVFETYKADWETFPFNGAKPRAWNDGRAEWNDLQWNCQGNGARSGDFFLAPSTAKYADSYPKRFEFFDNVVEFALAEPSSMLVAQNATLVRYLAAYNQIEFNQILAKEWYLADRLPKNERIEFLTGSLSVKSAWLDMGKLDARGKLEGRYTVANPETFHRRKAWLYDPYMGTCEQHVVGLVGLHIVQKTPKHRQWVWATFEHVMNAPESLQQLPGGDPTPVPVPSSCPIPSNPMSRHTFNGGTGAMQNMRFPLTQLFSAGCPPAPINIERKKKIFDGIIRDERGKILTDVDGNPLNTHHANRVWQRALEEMGSVWQYYQLVMTQWCKDDQDDNTPCSGTIPGPGFKDSEFKDSAFANTTLETWFQTNVEITCMSCHSMTRQHDFVWSLHMNAYPRSESRSLPAVRELQRFLGAQAR